MTSDTAIRSMSKRDLIIVLVSGFVGFLGGIIGGTLTGDFHIYIDSFTGPGHIAGEVWPSNGAGPDSAE